MLVLWVCLVDDRFVGLRIIIVFCNDCIDLVRNWFLVVFKSVLWKIWFRCVVLGFDFVVVRLVFSVFSLFSFIFEVVWVVRWVVVFFSIVCIL